MVKILVADDEPDLEALIKQKFRKKIREGIYEFVFAINGKDALDKLAVNEDVGIILSDINMPEMDGLTLLAKLSESNPLVKTVMVSAYGDMDNIRTAMNSGAFDFITKPINFQDLEITMEKTIEHVNHLRETLDAIRENNILKMYVDDSVLKFMGKEEFETTLLRSETIDASVVFVDICGFTSITEKESPEVVVNLLNTLFDVVVKEVLAQDGYIDKFIGDAAMAVFKGEYHLDRAIETALSVRQKIVDLPENVSPKGYKPNVSIGVCGGEMITGNIGSGDLRRLDHTVIGDVVNTAQRLQAAASEGQILITDSSYEKIKESFECKEVGDLSLRNKSGKIKAYEVLG